MEGTLRQWTIISVARFLWMVALICPVWGSPLATENEYALGLQQAKATVLEFTTDGGVTKESYTEFVTSLRNQLASDYNRHGIPVLRQPNKVADWERFLLVKLSNSPEATITLALDVTDANIVAYQAGIESYFFSDASDLAFSILFTDTDQKKLSFGGNYSELEKASGATRQAIDLGISHLDGAITTLYRSNRTPQNSIARALIVVIQMITETGRFRHIEQQVRVNIRTPDRYPSFRPDYATIELENNWIRLSIEIQESYQRAFSSAVMLRRANSEIFYADCVSEILKANLALLKFVCKSTEFESVSSAPDLHEVEYEVTCPALEPIAKIGGRRDRCLGVKDYNPVDGNNIIHWGCGINQYWTFKRDGTIRYQDKCLASYNFGPESYMVIYNCSTAPKPTTFWVVNTYGSIISPYSGMSVTTTNPYETIKLTLEITEFTSGQGWLPTNYTAPFPVSLMGFNDQCLKLKGTNNLWLQECANLGVGREWYIYTDGTIRPTSAPHRCLTCNSPFVGSEVIVLDCVDSGWSSQRWTFINDGRIMNIRSWLALDVQNLDGNLPQVIISAPNGKPSQKWLPLL
ncbi:hypothetical protein Tsubulata_029075 [Turnera subulata]|uniref:Ribosome-inactivating protein n=1 Tax=Turnera subulata TaxID=218843 RepID=A0A9Q0JDV5_9ROSI|nr:hypothetical protein Tsubulata_029075 [Turnera subulata]